MYKINKMCNKKKKCCRPKPPKCCCQPCCPPPVVAPREYITEYTVTDINSSGNVEFECKLGDPVLKPDCSLFGKLPRILENPTELIALQNGSTILQLVINADDTSTYEVQLTPSVGETLPPFGFNMTNTTTLTTQQIPVKTGDKLSINQVTAVMRDVIEPRFVARPTTIRTRSLAA